MRKYLLSTLSVVIMWLGVLESRAQFYSVRINTLGWATAAPNVGFGIALNRKFSIDLELMGGVLKMPQFSNLSLVVQQGMRYWFRESNSGSFLGIHITETIYDVGTAKYLFTGWGAGVGLSYGHSWYLSKRWNLGVEIGASLMYLNDIHIDRLPDYNFNTTSKQSERLMFLPTKFSFSVIYLF